MKAKVLIGGQAAGAWRLWSTAGALWCVLCLGAGEPAQGTKGSSERQGFFMAAAETVAVRVAGSGLLYEQRFETDALPEFTMTDPAAWRIASSEKGRALELFRQSRYQPPVRSPVNMAFIKDKAFGDFVLECDVIQTGREYGHRDMCLFFGFESPSRFYYAHIATAADDHAHNIFIVNDQPRTKIAQKTTKGVDWGLNVWHHVKVERTLADGLIKVYFDDMGEPIMVAEDRTFGVGFVGFGSFDDTGMVTNIRIWGPAVEAKPGPVFAEAK